MKATKKSIKNLVIVESPAKAKKISSLLGNDWEVIASVGHIRSIAKKAPKGQKVIDTDNDFATIYEIDSDKTNIVKELKSAAKKAETVWLASDDDREGEAIAWHLCQVIGLDPKTTKRIAYVEITKPAILAAIENPRQIDMNLVKAQQARQILDRLVGFELSPVVWRKVPGGKSAGRVQSPAVRLLVEREQEINSYKPTVSFKTSGEISTNQDSFKATLDTDFDSQETANDFLNRLKGAQLTVADINDATSSRKPLPPFSTSTLQQEANSRIGYSTKTTMSIAQKLYQNGFITYMRTDSVNLSSQVLKQAEQYITNQFGKEYYQRRTFKTKSASAQEAHEAIRPTDINRETVPGDSRDKKLYDLIRNRTLATQMADAKIKRTTATINIANQPEKFIAKGEVIVFDGFLKVMGASKDEILPTLASGDKLNLIKATSRQTFSRPPARYSEGSLVKKLEQLEIGRPSTYATIINNIQIRGYATKGESEGEERPITEITLKDNQVKIDTVYEKYGGNKGKLVPTDVGLVTNQFLQNYFQDIVDYKFTAKVEKELDGIASSKIDKVKMLKDFYQPFHDKITASDQIERSAVANQRLVGIDPKDNQPIYARFGRYGAMLQKGDSSQADAKLLFANMPAKTSIDTVTLEQAIKMFSLPRLVGQTEDGKDIIANIGRFGPYIKVDNLFVSIKPKSPFEISLDQARELYQEKLAQEAQKNIADFGDIKILNGRFGPYITDGTKNVKVPKDTDPQTMTKEDAKNMLNNAPTKPKRTSRGKNRNDTKR